MTWNLYQNNKFLPPLKFSNGKTQEDVVKEVLDEINSGKKIIFIHGICGTGKSGIALNIARKIGKTSIVVPIKNLQNQYKKDYESEKYLLKDNKEKLKISVITGRKNHKCKFLEDNNDAVPIFTSEKNSKLNDIFDAKRKAIKSDIGDDPSCDNYNIPCKIDIKEKNWAKLKQYIKQNKDVNEQNFNEIKDIKRISVAGVCPYFCPAMPAMYELGGDSFQNSIKREYMGLDNTKFVIYKRRGGCKFYEQFDSYIDADVIVFNSLKYKLESALNRKPSTEVEIIDECDEFLDSLSNQRTINLDRLQNSLAYVYGDEKTIKIATELNAIIKQLKRNPRVGEAFQTQEIIQLKETGLYDVFKIFLESREFLDEVDNESYLFEVEESVKMFDNLLSDTYVTFNQKEGSLIASVVTTNLAKKFNEMVKKNKVFVLMSGTLHSDIVLKDVFGLDEFKIIEAEVEKQGRIEIKKTGLEMDCKYSNFASGRLKRDDYLKALDKCVEISKKPTLVHVNAFFDLPSEEEKKRLWLINLITKDKLIEIQRNDKEGSLVRDFKQGKTSVLFSTRCGRGIDFPGEECNSIIFTKYPNPNVSDAFWKILAKTKPQFYWEFYRDKAKRELWQKIYRGLRFKEDHVYLLSPDTRVLEGFGI